MKNKLITSLYNIIIIYFKRSCTKLAYLPCLLNNGRKCVKMAKKYHSKHLEPSFPSADATIAHCFQNKNLGLDMLNNDKHYHYKSSSNIPGNKSISNYLLISNFYFSVIFNLYLPVVIRIRSESGSIEKAIVPSD
jgi:hypothetical protein